MFINFIYRLRSLGVPVGPGEALTLAEAMLTGLHENSVDGFYYVARATLIHHEGHLDAFDRAFLAEFEGIEDVVPELTEELRKWLDEAMKERGEQDEETQDFEELTAEQIEELKKQFEERLKEQTERHDGGPYWIGTGGTSRFGQGGTSKSGISTGSSGKGRGAMKVADARAYKPYRSDVVLDIRQFEVALKRLRAFVREGADEELDIERTIDATARNLGDIEIVTRPPSKPNTHVVLMADVGGSMYPYGELISRLFSATKKATHFKDLRTYYFHNCVYGEVYETDRFTDPVPVQELLRQCGPHYKLIMVGDAYMAPYELLAPMPYSAPAELRVSGLDWLKRIQQHFRRSAWLNPEPESRWRGNTIEAVDEVFDMYPMTVDGLSEAMAHLNRR